jgi:hypothetical protein
MARPLRIEYPGAVYDVTCRGNARERVFLVEFRGHNTEYRVDRASIQYCVPGVPPCRAYLETRG